MSLTTCGYHPAVPPPASTFFLASTACLSPNPVNPKSAPYCLFSENTRPQRDDLLELERQLAKLGLESKTGGPGGRARHRPGAGNPGAHLSSALGESFCLLNQSVIFGGGLGVVAAGGGLIGGGVSNGAVAAAAAAGVSTSPVSPAAMTTPAPPTAVSGSSRGDRGNPAESVRNGDAVRTDTLAVREARGDYGGAGRGGGDRGRVEGTQEGAAPPLRRESGESGGRRQVDAERGRQGKGAGDRRRPDYGRAVGDDGASSAGVGVAPVGVGVGGGGRSEPSWADDCARREQEATQQGEIMRLLTCLKTLGDENVSLMKECEDRDRVREGRWTPSGVCPRCRGVRFRECSRRDRRDSSDRSGRKMGRWVPWLRRYA